MIGRGKSISHTGNALGYGERIKENPEQAQEVSRNLVSGKDSKEIFEEFKMFQETNTRCQKNTLAFVISPDAKDTMNFKKGKYNEIVKKFLGELSANMNKDNSIKRNDIDLLKNNQHVAYIHKDTKTTHIHLYVNRIEIEGARAVPDNHISYKSANAADKVAQDLNLTRAREVMAQNIENKREIKRNLKLQSQRVFEVHRGVLKAKPQNVKEYTHLMKKAGFEPVFKLSKAGKEVGVQFKIAGALVKGSAINPTMAAGQILKSITKGLEIGKSIDRGSSLSL